MNPTFYISRFLPNAAQPALPSWPERFGLRLARQMDSLSTKLSDALGVWSKLDIFSGITLAKLGVVVCAAVIAVALFLFIRRGLSRHRASGTAPVHALRNGVLLSARKTLIWISLVSGLFLLATPLVPHLVPQNSQPFAFALAVKLAELGYFFSVLYFVLRVVRVLRVWLTDSAGQRSSPTLRAVMPLFGAAIYYNLLLAAASAVFYILGLPAPAIGVATKVLSIAAALVNTWLAIQTVLTLESIFISQAESRKLDIYKQRGIQTRVRVARQLLVFIISLIGIAIVLLNFDPVKRIGTGLLASAGVAGVIVGFAAQKSLATIIGGLQIAISQPMKIGDVLIVENEYAEVEEITLTYVVLRAWDDRRLVFPVTYFLEKYFQNWIRRSSQLLGTVLLYVDFQIPLDAVKREAKRIVESSPLWDRRAFAVQVTDLRPDCVEIRILASADSASRLFDLRCNIREELLTYLQKNDPVCFARRRAVLSFAGKWNDGILPERSVGRDFAGEQ